MKNRKKKKNLYLIIDSDAKKDAIKNIVGELSMCYRELSNDKNFDIKLLGQFTLLQSGSGHKQVQKVDNDLKNSSLDFSTRILICEDCGEEFVFTIQAQEYFYSRGWFGDPKHCKACSAKAKDKKRRSRSSFLDYEAIKRKDKNPE